MFSALTLPAATVLALSVYVVGTTTATPAGAQGRAVHVGGGGGFKPKYEGSDEYDGFAVPIIIPDFGQNLFAGRLDFRGLDDARFEAFRADPTGRSGFVAGPVIGYRFEREEEDGDKLRGLGDIGGGFIGGAFVGYRFGVFGVDAAYKYDFGDDAGSLIDFSASVKRRISPRVEITGRIGTTYADEDYTQTFFGVTAAQAATSVAGLQTFEADAGIKDVYVQVGSKINLDDRWTLRGQARYARLLGDAADSPVIETEDQFSGSLGLTYKLYLD